MEERWRRTERERQRWPSEIGGATGDLGALAPQLLAAITVGGLAPRPVVAGFGAAYLATAAVYRLPVPVQPMKAAVAVLVGAGASPESVATAGVMLGAALLALAASGAVERLERVVPQSVLLGLQLGLGVMLALAAMRLMQGDPLLAAVVLAMLALGLLRPGAPAALLALAVAVLWGLVAPAPETAPAPPSAVGPLSWEVVVVAARDLTGAS